MTRLLTVLPLLLTAACGAAGSVPELDGALTARLSAATPSASSGLVIDTLVVQVSEVVFDAEGPGGSISLSIEQQTAADLSDGSFDGLVPIDLTSGTYEDPYLGIEVWDDGPEPGIVLEGSLDGTPLQFLFNSGEVFEAESDVVVVPEDEVREVVLTLDPGAWFQDVDVSALTLDDAGVAVISETSNADVFDEVADRLDETTDGVFPGGESDDESDED